MAGPWLRVNHGRWSGSLSCHLQALTPSLGDALKIQAVKVGGRIPQEPIVLLRSEVWAILYWRHEAGNMTVEVREVTGPKYLVVAEPLLYIGNHRLLTLPADDALVVEHFGRAPLHARRQDPSPGLHVLFEPVDPPRAPAGTALHETHT